MALMKPDNRIQGKTHARFLTIDHEWYTPSCFVEAAREVMEGIDLDPASSIEANMVVRATHIYTKEEDGLSKSFKGRVWCNPPYGSTKGKSNQGLWGKKIIAEYREGNIEQAIFLCNAATDTQWFYDLWQFPICFTKGRVNFLTPKKTDKYTIGNTHGSAFVYLGANEQKFIDIFSQFGTIAKRVSPSQQEVKQLALAEVA